MLCIARLADGDDHLRRQQLGRVRTHQKVDDWCMHHAWEALVVFVSNTQAHLVLSSAEAELFAVVASASEGLGAKAMCLDCGSCVDVVINVGASAAICVA